MALPSAQHDVPERFNVCLVGSGGVGTIAALVLQKSGRADVTVVVRSNYNIVQERGWDIESVDHGGLKGWKPSRIVPSVQDAAEQQIYDYLVVSTKQIPEYVSVADVVAPVVTPGHTIIVLVQNGLNIHVPLIARYPENVVCSGVSIITSSSEPPNKLFQVGPDVLQVGPHYHPGVADSISLSSTETFVELYKTGGCAGCTLALDMPLARWRKILWNGSFNVVCALMRMNVGQVMRSGAKTTLILPLMREIAKVANADGCKLDEEAISMMVSTRSSESSTYKPSMLLDLERGSPTELEVILGHPVERARALGVDAPILTTVYELLKLVRWKADAGEA